MKLIPLALTVSAILAFTPYGWPAGKSGSGASAQKTAQKPAPAGAQAAPVEAPSPAPDASNDPGVASSEAAEKSADAGQSAQPDWEGAANPAPAGAPSTASDSGQVPEKTVKPVTAKAGKTAPDSAAPKAQAAKAEPTSPEDFKKLGDQLVKKGQAEKAMAAYKQCVDLAGEDTAYGKVVKILADYNSTKKKYADAAKYYSMIKGPMREQPAFQMMYGRSLQMSGKNAEAIELIEPLVADPKLKIDSRKEMWKILGDAYCKSDMNEKAVEWYGKYLKAGGAKTADVMFVMMNSVEKASPLKAKMGYEANIKSYPADYRNYLHLGIILSKTKATAQRATALLKKAGDLAGKNSAAWIEIAKAYGRAGKTDDELAAYQTVLSFDNANLYAKTRMGAIYLSRGMTTDAIYVLEEARKQAPDSAGPLVSLASCYMKTGKAKDAVELLVKAKSAKPKDAAVRKLLFEAYRATGKDQQALEEIKAAIDLKRDNESLLAYGKILLKMGKLDSAASVMEDIRSTAPDNVEALMVLAMVLRGQKKFDEAIELYKEISSIDPASAAPLYERAEVYLAQSKMKWAEQFYQRALQTDPKMAAAEVGLAKLARAYGNQAGYMEHLDKASAMDPDNPVVKKEIENSKKPMPAPGKK